MTEYKYPEERQLDHIKYILHKYLNDREQWKVVYNKLSNRKLIKLLDDIREDEK